MLGPSPSTRPVVYILSVFEGYDSSGKQKQAVKNIVKHAVKYSGWMTFSQGDVQI